MPGDEVKAVKQHDWRGIADGVVPIAMPFDGNGPAQRFVLGARAPFATKQKCASCGIQRTRTWEQPELKVAGRGIGVHDLVETTKESPPCV